MKIKLLGPVGLRDSVIVTIDGKYAGDYQTLESLNSFLTRRAPRTQVGLLTWLWIGLTGADWNL